MLLLPFLLKMIEKKIMKYRKKKIIVIIQRNLFVNLFTKMF
jgi:hypothetical protein